MEMLIHSTPLFAAVGYSLIYMLGGGGLFGVALVALDLVDDAGGVNGGDDVEQALGADGGVDVFALGCALGELELGAAVLAAPAQRQPRHQRDVQIPRDGIFAVRAMRWRRDDAHAQRQPVDAHVQKAADDASQREENQRPKMERYQRPVRSPRSPVHSRKHNPKGQWKPTCQTVACGLQTVD